MAAEIAEELKDAARDDETRIVEAEQSHKMAYQLREKLNSLRSSLSRVSAATPEKIEKVDDVEVIDQDEAHRVAMGKKALQVKTKVDSLLARIEKEMETVRYIL